MNRIGNELCLFKQNLFSEAMLKYHTSFIFYFCDADTSIETPFIPTYQCSFLALVRKKKIMLDLNSQPKVLETTSAAT